MIRFLRRVGMTLSAAALFSLPALAQGMGGMQGPGGGGILAALDSNDDGVVTFEEIRESRRAAHARLDGDGDGVLSREEAGSRVSPMGGNDPDMAFLAADTDFDGVLSQWEFVEAPIPALTRIDTDLDSRLTADEFQAMRQRMMESRMSAMEDGDGS